MKIRDFIKIMEEIAPPELKESYDNVGLMVGDTASDFSKVLIALDCTKSVIEEAEEIGAELILSHHPLLFKKPSSITDESLQGEKIRMLVKKDIALYSAHTNWDSAKGGLNELFAEVLGLKNIKIMDKNPAHSDAGIGRIGNFDSPVKLKVLIDTVKSEFGLENLRYAGNPDSEIRNVAVINGSGQDYFSLAYNMGADLVITGDTTYHYVSDYYEMGMAVMDIGHFNSEWKLLKMLASDISEKVKDKGVEVVLSRNCTDPYKFA